MMESLQLPIEMLWQGKTEPMSPSQITSTSFEEFSFEDDFAEDYSFDNAIILDSKLCNIDKLQDILLINEIADTADEVLCKEDQWLNGRVDNAPFSHDYPTQSVGFYPAKTANTEDLLLEFDSIYDSVEYTHLTPPQTPPEFTKSLTEERKRISQYSIVAEEFSQLYYQSVPTNFENADSKPIQISFHDHQQELNGVEELQQNIVFDDNDIARELELLEELIRSRSKVEEPSSAQKSVPAVSSLNITFDEDDGDDEDSYGSGSATSSCPVSPRSESSFSESKASHDDEWYPTAVKSTTSKRRSKPYSRTSEDRKSRKKEQNKNAATRYRQKKKQETEEILSEERVLLDVNKGLQSKYKDIRREIKYLKDLLRELYQVKGGLNN